MKRTFIKLLTTLRKTLLITIFCCDKSLRRTVTFCTTQDLARGRRCWE